MVETTKKASQRFVLQEAILQFNQTALNVGAKLSFVMEHITNKK